MISRPSTNPTLSQLKGSDTFFWGPVKIPPWLHLSKRNPPLVHRLPTIRVAGRRISTREKYLARRLVRLRRNHLIRPPFPLTFAQNMLKYPPFAPLTGRRLALWQRTWRMISVKSTNSTRHMQYEIPDTRCEIRRASPLATANWQLANPATLPPSIQTAHPANSNHSPVTSHEPPSSTSVENPLQIRPFRAKQTQFPKRQKSTQILFTQRVTTICPLSHYQKQTQSKPKRTQSKPNLPKTQKPTQPLFSQRVIEMEAPSHSQKQTQTNPICPAVALLPRPMNCGSIGRAGRCLRVLRRHRGGWGPGFF